MYLAPLNYDLFFKKVFSHLHIAKKFLEDFLDVEITHIEKKEKIYRFTDKSIKIELDFHCVINGSEIIIEMQQWYKTDIVKRFYLYHCAGTVAQLEEINEQKKIISTETDSKKHKSIDYSVLKPQKTLIWMVDDTLKNITNYIEYCFLPSKVGDFLRNDNIWFSEKNWNEIINIRKDLLKILKNTTKDLDFIEKNSLYFIFQPNIIQSKNLEKYQRWFKFAEKTRNLENTKEDFVEFENEDIFIDIMKLTAKNNLDVDELEYINKESLHYEEVQRFVDGEYKLGLNDGINETKQQLLPLIEHEKQRAEIEKLRADKKEKELEIEKNKLLTIIVNLYKRGFSVEEISEINNLDKFEIENIIKNNNFKI